MVGRASTRLRCSRWVIVPIVSRITRPVPGHVALSISAVTDPVRRN